MNVPVLWWRSVGHTHTAFVMETLIDELAARAPAWTRSPTGARLLKPEARKLHAALDLLEAQSAAWRAQAPEASRGRDRLPRIVRDRRGLRR